MIEFDKSTHQYTFGGIQIPSVTQIIPKPQFYCTPEQLESARIDGEENHSLIKMFWDTRQTGSEPILEALDTWIGNNTGMIGELVQHETPMFSKKYNYAGKPDAIFEKAVIDFKRNPGNNKIHALQIAAYHALAVENKIIQKNKVHLILWFDGSKFRAKNVYDPCAEWIFISLVKKYYIDKEFGQWMNSN
jgi:hypothetical protein